MSALLFVSRPSKLIIFFYIKETMRIVNERWLFPFLFYLSRIAYSFRNIGWGSNGSEKGGTFNVRELSTFRVPSTLT